MKTQQKIKTHQKILIGGLGALTPVILSLLVVDLNVLLRNFNLIFFLGYLIKVGILFYLGGLVAYLHKDEKNPIKLFELGIVAPALITSLINASRIEVSKLEIPHASISISSVYAQPTHEAYEAHEEKIKTFSLPKETLLQKLWRGFITSPPKEVWFVIVSSHRKFEEAKSRARDITNKGFKAEVYAPYKENPYYTVVIGANLTYQDAQKLHKKAIKAGLTSYLWKLE